MTARQLEVLLGRPIAAVETAPYAYASSHPLELVTVRFAEGDERRLVVKHPGRLLPEARTAKPGAALAAGRELHAYRSVVHEAGVGAPELLGVTAGRLVLEHVDGVPLTEVGDLTRWEDAARAVARMHRRFAHRVDARLPRLDASHLARWVERARAFRGDSINPLVDAFRTAAERVLDLPITVVHGEFYPANVLVHADGHICVLDWETVARGPGLLDLAALTSGSFGDLERSRLLTAYAGELGVRDPAELSADLDRCRLLLAVQWLGWSAGWAPPAGQRTDWLVEAVRAAEAIA